MYFPEFLLVLNNFNFDVWLYFLLQPVFQIFRIAVLYFLFTISLFSVEDSTEKTEKGRDERYGLT